MSRSPQSQAAPGAAAFRLNPRHWFARRDARSAPRLAVPEADNPAQPILSRIETARGRIATADDLFYNLLMRIGLLGDLSRPLRFASETERNLVRRRLEGEAAKLVTILSTMEAAQESLRLAIMELRACHFGPGAEGFRAARDENVAAAETDLTQATRSMGFIEETGARVSVQLDWLARPAPTYPAADDQTVLPFRRHREVDWSAR